MCGGRQVVIVFSDIYFIYVIKDIKQQRLTHDLVLTELLIQVKNNY